VLLTHANEATLLDSEGVQFIMKPSCSEWRAVKSLSGGQQALCAVALSMALQVIHPSPLYLLDEVDAALDTTNITSVTDLMLNVSRGNAGKSRPTQFIAVSHHASLFERTDQLIGVYGLKGGASAVQCLSLHND
jgi:chromosome segregation ATPase